MVLSAMAGLFLILGSKLWIFEFDLLQVTPFWRAYENKEVLFFNPKDKVEIYWQIGELSKKQWMYIWTNRLNAEFLEWFEHLIQSPDKLFSEVLWESRKDFEDFFSWKSQTLCPEDKCPNCFLEDFCMWIKNRKKISKFNLNNVAVLNNYINDILPDANFVALRSEGSIDEIKAKFWSNWEKFKEFILKLELNKWQQLLNVPKCLREDNNQLHFESFDDLNCDENLESYSKIFVEQLYRKKSIRCSECFYYNSCQWLHINFIKAYWFKLFKPIIKK